MKIRLMCTSVGLKPLYDEDYDEKKRLKLGEIYEADIKQPRNLEFLQKYHVMIRTAWELMPQESKEFFGNQARRDFGLMADDFVDEKLLIERFRKTLELAAGSYETVWSVKRNEWLQIPKSIAFDRMKEDEFSKVYEAVRSVIFAIFLRDEALQKQLDLLSNF